jgi:nucleoside-diphosphate-sugar epimerase
VNNICVIGGSRYFGPRLIELLRDSGARVTVINRGSTPPPPGAIHLVADRDDEEALRAAVADREFDGVLDQVCYTPHQAAIARRVFGGRTRRYVMTSTIEVYDPATSTLLPPAVAGIPVTEEAVDPASWPISPGQARHESAAGEATRYAEGKRQAEAVFTRERSFEFVTVRSAHVLGIGARDFTRRLEHYAERIVAGRPVDVHRDRFPTSFINDEEIADLLFWTVRADCTGAVNACSHGALDVTDLCDLIAAATGRAVRYRPVEGAGASPFSFDRYYAMDNSRATRLGYAFSSAADWLPKAVAAAIEPRKGS